MQAELSGLGFKVVANRPSLEQQREEKDRLNKSSASVDTLKELEEEKRKIRILKDCIQTNKSKEEHLQQELKQVLEVGNKERKINDDLTRELNESKDRLQQIRNEITQLLHTPDEDEEKDEVKKEKKSKREKKGKKEKKKDKYGTVGSSSSQKPSPSRTPSSPAIILSDKDHQSQPQRSSLPIPTSKSLSSSTSPVSATPSPPSPGSSPGPEQTGVRSWSKKVVGTYSDVNVQLEVEKEKRQELDKYKVDNEGKIEDMKRLVRMEVDAKIKAEEDCLRTEREIAQLKEKLKQLSS